MLEIKTMIKDKINITIFLESLKRMDEIETCDGRAFTMYRYKVHISIYSPYIDI